MSHIQIIRDLELPKEAAIQLLKLCIVDWAQSNDQMQNMGTGKLLFQGAAAFLTLLEARPDIRIADLRQAKLLSFCVANDNLDAFELLWNLCRNGDCFVIEDVEHEQLVAKVCTANRPFWIPTLCKLEKNGRTLSVQTLLDLLCVASKKNLSSEVVMDTIDAIQKELNNRAAPANLIDARQLFGFWGPSVTREIIRNLLARAN